MVLQRALYCHCDFKCVSLACTVARALMSNNERGTSTLSCCRLFMDAGCLALHGASVALERLIGSPCEKPNQCHCDMSAALLLLKYCA